VGRGLEDCADWLGCGTDRSRTSYARKTPPFPSAVSAVLAKFFEPQWRNNFFAPGIRRMVRALPGHATIYVKKYLMASVPSSESTDKIPAIWGRSSPSCASRITATCNHHLKSSTGGRESVRSMIRLNVSPDHQSPRWAWPNAISALAIRQARRQSPRRPPGCELQARSMPKLGLDHALRRTEGSIGGGLATTNRASQIIRLYPACDRAAVRRGGQKSAVPLPSLRNVAARSAERRLIHSCSM